MDSLPKGYDIMIKTRFALPSLTKSEKKVAEKIIENPSEIVELTLSELGEIKESSPAFILRFCRKLDLGGFSDLKAQLMTYLNQNPNYQANANEVNKDDTMNQILRKVFWSNIQTLKDTLALVNDDYEKAMPIIAYSKNISFYCVGDAAVPCTMASIKFNRIGLASYVYKDSDAQLINACMLTKEDTAIAISHSGRTRSVVEAMKVAKENGARTICITKMEKSILNQYCDIKLYTATSDTTAGNEMIGRRVAEQAILEALYLGVLVKMRPELQENALRVAKLLNFNKL